MRETGFRCYYADCGKRFLSRYKTTRHVNTTHLELKPFTCPRCKWQCSSKPNLNSHLQTHINRLKRREEEPIEDVPSDIRKLTAMIKNQKYGLSDRPSDELPELDPNRQWIGRLPLCPGLLQQR